MKSRISAFINLPLASIDRLALQPRLHVIGRMDGATALNMIKVPGSSPQLREVLVEASLPTDDLTDEGQKFFRFARGASIVGFGGYQLCDGDVLLRSVVLVPSARGKGDGLAATELLLEQAAADGAKRAYLLTETAASFFERLGFERIDRERAPEAVRKTRQASSLCPSSASLMTVQLDKSVAA